MRLSITILADQLGTSDVKFSILVNGAEVAKDLKSDEAEAVVETSLRRLSRSAKLLGASHPRNGFETKSDAGKVSIKAPSTEPGPHDLDSQIAGFAEAAFAELQTELSIEAGMEELLTSATTREPELLRGAA
jgi:hypothetical protein